MSAPGVLPPLADVAMLRAWPEVDIPAEQEPAAVAVLARASAVVRRQARRTWVDENGGLASVPADIPGIVVAAAARFWNNPDGATMRVRGPYTEQYSQAIEAGVYLTPTEKDDVDDLVSPRRRGLSTITVTRDHGDLDTGAVFVTDGGGGDPILYEQRW